jgi:hypothetical protein
MAGLGERIKAFRARRTEGKDARRAARRERAQKKARAEAQRLEHKRVDTGKYGGGGDGGAF